MLYLVFFQICPLALSGMILIVILVRVCVWEINSTKWKYKQLGTHNEPTFLVRLPLKLFETLEMFREDSVSKAYQLFKSSLPESSHNIPNVSKTSGGEHSWKAGFCSKPLIFLFRRMYLPNTTMNQDYNQNHTLQRQRKYLNKDTRYSPTSFWNLIDCSGDSGAIKFIS